MQRRTFEKKNFNTQRPRVDRFVAPRVDFPEMSRRIVWGSRWGHRVNDLWYSKYLRQNKYMNYLDEAFGLEPLKPQASRDAEPQGQNLQSWPCVPRKRSYLSSADSILDLPTYSFTTLPELLDWSNDNVLVAALGLNYHKWSWRSQSLISQGFTQYEIQCCKFDPRGDLLLLGTSFKRVEIHDNALSKFLVKIFCRCLSLPGDFCSITAIDWSPTGNSFVTGCSKGMLMAISRNGDVIKQQQVIDEPVLVVRISPNARFVAAAGVSGDVLVMTWPDLLIYSCLTSDWTIKALTWHPWRSALLGIGTVTPTLRPGIALWDAPTSIIQEWTLSQNPYILDTMLFSHKTGELVLSLWNSDSTADSKNFSRLVVMSDPVTVVDQWGEGRLGLDRVRTMVFSPDGTKLATATADEDLIIWNFLPEDKLKKRATCRRFSAMPVYLDETTYGFSLR